MNRALWFTFVVGSNAFAPIHRASSPSFVAMRAFNDADSLLNKIDSGVSNVAAPVVEQTTEAAATPVMVENAGQAVSVVPNWSSVIPPAESLPVVSLPEVSLPAIGGDLSISIIAGALLVVAVVAAVVSGGSASTTTVESSAVPVPAEPTIDAIATSTPTPAEEDLSIPYDAAARLAYEKAGQQGDYEAFKTKYEADAVAEVKAKRKK